VPYLPLGELTPKRQTSPVTSGQSQQGGATMQSGAVR